MGAYTITNSFFKSRHTMTEGAKMVIGKEWCRNIVKGLYMSVNGLIVLLSYFILAFAVVDIRLLSNYSDQQPAGTIAGNLSIISSCTLLIFISIFGILGAVKGNIKYLFMYIAALMIMMVLQIMIGIYVGVQRRELQYRVAEWLREDFFQNATDVEQHTNKWDELQTKYECCGLNGPEDYLAIDQTISISCCQRAYRARTLYAQKMLYAMCIESKTYNKNGCEDEILDILREDSECLLGASVFILWIEGIAVILCVWVSNNMRDNVHVYKTTTVKY